MPTAAIPTSTASSGSRRPSSTTRSAKRLPVALGRLALRFALPLTPQDVPALEVGAVGGFLEDEVLGEARRVVADVKTVMNTSIGPPGRPRCRSAEPSGSQKTPSLRS